jgi:HSP20 family molecular chaperone IbpA
MVGTIGHYNPRLYSGDFVSEEWEDGLIDQLLSMFNQLGMEMTRDQLMGLINQIRGQFEGMGIDMEKLESGDIAIDAQANMDALAKAIGSMMSNGGEIGDLLGTMGFKVDVQPKTVTVETPTQNENNDSNSESGEELEADVHIWNSTMHITIDLTHDNVEDDNLDLTLTDGGTILQIIKGNQLRPFRKLDLERVVEEVISWDLNNGILDIELSIDGKDGNIKIE